MQTEHIRKAVVAFFGTLIALLVALGMDEGGLRELFTEERIETVATVIGAAGTVAYIVWGVPNEPPGGAADGFSKDEDAGLSAGLALCLALVLALAACTPGYFGETLQQRFYAAVEGYAAVKDEAAAYLVSGPLCSELEVLGCVPDEAAIAIDDVTDEFDPRIEAAIAIFESDSATPADQRAQISLARQALRELSATLAAAEGT